MRYALRNQRKIKEKLGQKKLDIIIKSLDVWFDNESNETIDFLISENTEKPYKCFAVNNQEFKNMEKVGVIVFYVITKTYDVYKLAYKEFVN